jgi:hypothetical protein
MNSRFDFRLWGCISLFWNLYIRSWDEKKKGRGGEEKREEKEERVHSIRSIPGISCVFYTLSMLEGVRLQLSIRCKSGKPHLVGGG